MIPFNPNAVYEVWHHAWRVHIYNAKTNPAQREGYCRAAAISQAMYVCWLAIEMERKPRG